MQEFVNIDQEYTAFFLFCGIGGAALGAQQAEVTYRGLRGRCTVLGGIDNDPDACADFEMLTGVKATCLDLFDREQYLDWNGHEPPADWHEASLEEIRAAAQGIDPDVVVVTAPCKGFSGLLSQEKSSSRKYQALNKLTFRGIFLTLETWRHNLPSFILFENVPRIATRGKKFLREIRDLLSAYGYVFDATYHDCGELGGLAQHRKRYLLVARNQAKVSSYLYHPPKQRVRAIGEVLGEMPLPDDPVAGPLHHLPRLSWKTWVRLALIPPGGDWRDLQKVKPGEYFLQPCIQEGTTHSNRYRVLRRDRAASTVTGSKLGSGASATAGPRKEYFGNFLNLTAWDQPTRTITGATGPYQSANLVADPRLGCKPRSGSYGVLAWDKPANTVTSSADVHAGAAAVADPRIPSDGECGVWVIVSPWGYWHRPLTTLELLALQGFPWKREDGRPIELAGRSDKAWRERIGNAVPPLTMKAIMGQVLYSLLASETNDWRMDVFNTGIWVQPETEETTA